MQSRNIGRKNPYLGEILSPYTKCCVVNRIGICQLASQWLRLSQSRSSYESTESLQDKEKLWRSNMEETFIETK